MGMRRGSKAFTLIELLVVVSIIALLVSILLPALGRARDAARISVCAANQRSVGLAICTYTAENNGRFPPAVLHVSQGTWEPAIPGAIFGHYCQTLLAEYVGTRDAGWYEEEDGWEDDTLLIFQCPAQPASSYDREHFKAYKTYPLGSDPSETLRVSSSYAYSWNIGRGNLRPDMAVIPAMQTGNLRTPSEVVMLNENWPGFASWFYPPNAGRGGDYYRTWPYCASWRHGQGTTMNVAMADGHVEKRQNSDPAMMWDAAGPVADGTARIWGPPGG